MRGWMDGWARFEVGIDCPCMDNRYDDDAIDPSDDGIKGVKSIKPHKQTFMGENISSSHFYVVRRETKTVCNYTQSSSSSISGKEEEVVITL